MAYNVYANDYDTMYKIGTKYCYSSALNLPNGEKLKIFQDSGTGKFFIQLGYNSFIQEIINVALGHYSYKFFGYSEAGGQIVVTNPSAISSFVHEEYYSGYFSKSYRWTFTYNDGASKYIIQTVLIDGNDYVNISDIGTALGFSFSMEKDDAHRIQLIKVAKL